jgi:hypothetical protein
LKDSEKAQHEKKTEESAVQSLIQTSIKVKTPIGSTGHM